MTRNSILAHGVDGHADCVWRKTVFPSAQGDASRFEAGISAVMGVVVGRCKQGPAVDRSVVRRVGLGLPNPDAADASLSAAKQLHSFFMNP